MLQIRPATDEDHDAIWEIFHAVVCGGRYLCLRSTNVAGRCAGVLVRLGLIRTYIAEQDGRVSGSYYIARNQQGGGDHVANAGFMVASSARGFGLGRAMAEHCLSEARRFGFRAMQFNFVVSTNESALRLWRNLGFKIVGTLPGAFRHPARGFVDVYVMFRSLAED